MLPSFRSVRRLLQTKGPSGSRLNSSTVWIRFWVLSTVRRLMLFTANGCNRDTEKPRLAQLVGIKSLTPFASSLKGYGYASLVQAGWASLEVETQRLFCTQNKLKFQERKWSLAICHIESEAASTILVGILVGHNMPQPGLKSGEMM